MKIDRFAIIGYYVGTVYERRSRKSNARVEDFSSVVEAAKEAMGLNANTKVFSSDVLRVEVTGPSQAHFTLVDLHGLIHAENKQQSAKLGQRFGESSPSD